MLGRVVVSHMCMYHTSTFVYYCAISSKLQKCPIIFFFDDY